MGFGNLNHYEPMWRIPALVKDKKEALGEELKSDQLVTPPYKLEFLSEKESEIACKRKLTKEEVAEG